MVGTRSEASMSNESERNRIHAHIEKQREILQHLEDTLDNDDEALKRVVYIDVMLKNLVLIKYLHTIICARMADEAPEKPN